MKDIYFLPIRQTEYKVMMTIKGCTKFFYVITSKIGVVLLKSYLFID